MDRHTLIRLRADLGISQSQLGQLLGTTKEAVHYYERGRRAVPSDVRGVILHRLARAAARDRDAARAACLLEAPVEERLFVIFTLAREP